MLDVVGNLPGLSISQISLAIGVGNLLKAGLNVVAVGPMLDRYGMQTCACVTMAAAATLVALLATTTTSTSFCAVLVLLVSLTSFAEQPCFICLNATHFRVLVSFASSAVASAFSIAGALLPLLLAPLLASAGWRAALWALGAGCVALLPIMMLFLRPGTLAVGSSIRHLPAKADDTQDPGKGAIAASATSSSSTTTAETASAATTDVAEGVSAAVAFRGSAFWALWSAMLLHLTYGSFLSGQLTTALRIGSHLDVVQASLALLTPYFGPSPLLTPSLELGAVQAARVNAVQFGCAIAGKLCSGTLLAMPHSVQPLARAILFVLAPLAYCGSHLLLVDVDLVRLGAGDVSGGLRFARAMSRLLAYAVVVGLPFGLIFGTLTCLPARLFGRKDLPKIQSATYSAILLSAASTGALVGYLRDLFQGYEVPLLLTAASSFVQIGLLLFLMRADVRACARANYESL